MAWVNGPHSAKMPQLPAIAEGYSLAAPVSFGTKEVFFVRIEHPGTFLFL